VILGAYYDMKIHKQPAGFGLDIEQRSRIKERTILVVVTVILIFVGLPLVYGMRYWADESAIHITKVEIGWTDSEERLFVQPTDLTPPNKQWAANIHYVGTVTQEITIALTSIYPESIPDDTKVRYQLEDQEWDRTVSILKYNQDQTIKIAANSPTFITIKGPTLDSRQINDMIAHKTAVYFMAAFEKKGSSLPEAGVCIYREGPAPVIHNCHDHNFP
jgi:hypothetical protein